MTRISALPAETAPSSTDSIPMLDQETMTTKRTTLALLQPYDNPYKFSVYKSTDQTGIADATFTKLQFNTELVDTNSNFDSATNYRYTAPISGFYQINGHAALVSSNSTGVAAIVALYINGSEYMRSDLGSPSSGNSASVFSGGLSDLIQLTAGDYIELFVYIDTTSGTRSAASGVKNARFSGFLVSRT